MSSPPPRSEDSSDTEDRILQAAHRVFLRRGTAGARMQEIADEAEVNKALLHYYFRSKDRLAHAVFLRAARTLFPRALQAIASDIPLREKLQQVIEIELDVLEKNPYLPGYLIAEFQYRPEQMSALLEEAVDVGRFRGAVLGKLQHQLDEEAASGRLRPMRAEDFMVALMAQLVFPFAAAPMLRVVLGIDDETRMAMIRRRRDELADALLRSFAR